MQHVNANDYMTGSAKRAVETALADSKAQRMGGATPTPPTASGERSEGAQAASR